MRTDWPAPTPEAEILDLVHRRARVLGVHRLVKRTVPVLAVLVALCTSIVARDDGGPASLRVVGEGTPTEEASSEEGAPPPQEGPREGGSTEHGEEDPSNLSITPRPASEVPVEHRSPKQLPLVPQSPLVPRPHLVDDPEGDDTPNNDAVDLRYGDLAYDRGRDRLRFTFGVTNLAAAPVGVGYGVRFQYDGRYYGVHVMRRQAYPRPVVQVGDRECDSCSVALDEKANEVRVDVPLAVMNDRVATNTTSYWPPEERQSPPMREGATLSWFSLSAYVQRGGPIDGTDQTQPHDAAESDKEWVLR